MKLCQIDTELPNLASPRPLKEEPSRAVDLVERELYTTTRSAILSSPPTLVRLLMTMLPTTRTDYE